MHNHLSVKSSPHVATNADGRLEVFVQGSDNHLWHIYQVKAGQDWSDWYDLGPS